MKGFLTALALTAIVSAAHAQSEGAAARDGVTATGQAEVRVVPDQVEISLGVETRDTELGRARKLNDDAVNAVIAAAKRHGVDAAHIKTDYVSIEPDYVWQSTSTRAYAVRKSLVVTATNIDGFDALLADLVHAGANHVHSVRFLTSELRKHRDEARKLAATAAREKAELLATTLGRSIGGARSIAEGTDDWWSSYGSWWGWGNNAQNQNVSQAAASSSMPDTSGIAPGQISVRARVTVTFDLR